MGWGRCAGGGAGRAQGGRICGPLRGRWSVGDGGVWTAGLSLTGHFFALRVQNDVCNPVPKMSFVALRVQNDISNPVPEMSFYIVGMSGLYMGMTSSLKRFALWRRSMFSFLDGSSISPVRMYRSSSA